jgi:tetratricopeptide (TPR) repeat protein
MSETLETLVEQGRDWLASYELVEAEEAFERALALVPDSVEVHLGMARLHLLQGAPQKAKEWAEKAADLTDHKAEAHALVASCDLQMDNVTEALALLKRTNQWYPDHPLVLSNLGKAYSIDGNYKEARVHSLKALELGAIAEEVHYDLGNICGGLGEYDEAVDHFVAAIEANPSYLPPYLRLGQFARLLGLFDEVVPLFEAGVALMPEMPLLQEELYVLYMFQQAPRNAMEQALSLAELRGWAVDYIRVGNTALLLEDMNAAKVAYETALEVDPDELGAHLNLGHWHRLMKERAEALERYQHVAEQAPASHKPYLGLGLTYLELDEDIRKAHICFLKAMELSPQEYDVLIHLAGTSLALEETAEAKTYATVAMGIAKSPREHERAQEILSQCP